MGGEGPGGGTRCTGRLCPGPAIGLTPTMGLRIGPVRMERARPLDTDPRARIVGGSMMGAAQFEASDPQFEARVRASFARQGAMALIGTYLVSVAPGAVDISPPYGSSLSSRPLL